MLAAARTGWPAAAEALLEVREVLSELLRACTEVAQVQPSGQDLEFQEWATLSKAQNKARAILGDEE